MRQVENEIFWLYISVAMLLFALAAAVGCGCSSVPTNPASSDYPCGTRAHACSSTPLSCCWNGSVCGASGTSCPAGMCCADEAEEGAVMARQVRR